MTRIQKFMAPIMAVSFGIVLFSCNNGGEKKEDEKKAEDTIKTLEPVKPAEPAVAAFTPFKVMMVRQTVADFDKWKVVYLSNDSMRSAYGISRFVYGRGLNDPKSVIVINKFTDVQKAKDFSMRPGLKEVMKKGGVIGKPVFSYADVIRNVDTKIDQKERVMVAHKVKNFDAWLKVYDAEGEAKRMESGMLDRGLARGVDDPNMVYIVFAITDMTKAKARMNSPELKKIMMDAGVEGPPQIFFYKLED